jgi:hypothetical protein
MFLFLQLGVWGLTRDTLSHLHHSLGTEAERRKEGKGTLFMLDSTTIDWQPTRLRKSNIDRERESGRKTNNT